MNTNTETIRVNNVDLPKDEVYEYLFDILMKYYNRFKEDETEWNEKMYLDTCDFIRTIIGEENVEEFQEYTSDLLTYNYQ